MLVPESELWRASKKSTAPLKELFSGSDLRRLGQLFVVMSGAWLTLNATVGALPGVINTFLGADVNTWDAKGQTALHAMLKKGSDKAHFETLLRRGARGDIAGPDGQTAIDLMRRKRDPEFRRMAEALARAGDQPDAEMIAAAERVAAIIEGGAVAPPAGAFASHGVTIIENFAPFVFEGPGSIERWCEQTRAHLSGVTALRHTFGPGQDFSRRGDDVYFSLPTHWRGLKNGQPFAEDGGWAFVLTRHGDMWRVRAYGWAVTRFTTTLQS